MLPKELIPVKATMETVTQTASSQVTSTAQYFRDEKARTRIEHGDMASIHDPEQEKTFLLNLKDKTAIPVPATPPAPTMPQAPRKPGMPAPPPLPAKPPEMQETADLGEKLIEGIKAHGKQYSAPVPGRPQPVTSEIWMAPDLKLPLQTTMKDPSTGTTSVTKMKDIVAGPKLNPGLFQVPPDFKIVPPGQPPPLPPLKPPPLPVKA